MTKFHTHNFSSGHDLINNDNLRNNIQDDEF